MGRGIILHSTDFDVGPATGMTKINGEEETVYTVTKRYFRLERRDLVYLTFILEAYEGLATLSTVDKKETLVSITTLAGGAADLDFLVSALQNEISLTEVPEPLAQGSGGEHA